MKVAEHEMFRGTVTLSDAQVGDPIGVLDVEITDESVERTAWAMDDYNPWYMESSPFGGRIASPTALLRYNGPLFYGRYAYPPGGSLYAKQEFEFIAPIRVGEKYRLTGTLVDRYPRRGRTFYRMSVTVTDRTGAEVMRMGWVIATPVTAEPEDRP